jgi:hypothetical protein
LSVVVAPQQPQLSGTPTQRRLREASKVKQLSEAKRVIEQKDARIKELEEERQGGGPFDFAHDEVEAIATTLLQLDRDKAVRLARLILDELPAAEPPRVKRTAAKGQGTAARQASSAAATAGHPNAACGAPRRQGSDC